MLSSLESVVKNAIILKSGKIKYSDIMISHYANILDSFDYHSLSVFIVHHPKQFL